MLSHLIRGTLVLCVCAALAACATSTQGSLHSFKFDARIDSPEIEILDYRYGTVKVGPSQADRSGIARGSIPQLAGVTGYFPRGDSLYVKWRIKETKQEYEDTVDLKSRLPSDIFDHTIYFIVKGPVLLVYLISPERRPSEMAPQGPRTTQYRKTYVIYPDHIATLKR